MVMVALCDSLEIGENKSAILAAQIWANPCYYYK